LLHGARLLLVPEHLRRDPEGFHAAVAHAGVTVLSQTPSAFRQFMAADAAAPTDRPPLALRHVIFGGEALDLPSLLPWFDRHPHGKPELVNLYGITETTVHVTWRPITPQDAQEGRGSLIGRPLRDLDLHVLDEALQFVPPGFPGELCVGGAGLARGYLNQPSLTAERFVEWPATGQRLYRSGDRARRVGAADLAYLGRFDDQIKLRGFRIELGEITAALQEISGVQDAAVGVHGDQLVAWVVPASLGQEHSRLTTALMHRLPAYMVPRRWVGLDRLPLTANGKLDRRSLAELWAHRAPHADPSPAAPHPPEAGSDPSTPSHQALAELEAEIATIWAGLLERSDIDRDANFFDLGGHSLMAASVKQALLARLKQDLPMVSLFQFPTVRLLARHLHSLRGGPDAEVRAGESPGVQTAQTEDRQQGRQRLSARRQRRGTDAQGRS
jgi:acyl carrier protein